MKCIKNNIFRGMRIFSGILLLLIAINVSCAKKEPEVIKIGAIVPLTGPFAVYGEPVHDGMLLAVEEINSAGGINGTKIKLIVEDDAGDPKQSVNSFIKLASVEKVPVILGPLSSGCSMATAPIADRKKVVQISTLAGIPDLSTAGDYVFRIYPSSDLGARYAAQTALDMFKPTKVAILYMNNPFGETAKEIYKKMAEEAGVNVVAMKSFNDGETDFRTPLSAIKTNNPDILFCSAYWGEGSRILVQLQELGMDIIVVGEDGWRGPIAEIVGEKGLKNLYFADIAFGTDIQNNAIMQKFIENFEQKYKKKASTYSASGYDAVYLVKKAIETSQYNSEKIKNALYQIDYFGSLGSIRYDHNGDNIGVQFALFQLNKYNEAIIVK